jgi:hypothetical protein
MKHLVILALAALFALPFAASHNYPRAVDKGGQRRGLASPSDDSQGSSHCSHFLGCHPPILGRSACSLYYHHGPAYDRLPGRSR